MTGSGRRRRLPGAGAVVLIAAFVGVAGALTFVALRGPAGTGDVQEQVRAVASSLRCPVCQNLSVADSPSALAREMRATIERQLRAGLSQDRIRAGFVRAYGDWVLLEPPRRGFSLVAWLAPLALLVGGVVVVMAAIRRWTPRATSGEGRPDEAEAGSGSCSVPADLSPADRRLLAAAMAESEGEIE